MTTVIIKKYANNKLYIARGNTEPVGYTTLERIIAIIRSGKDVRVIDNKSGEDLTVQTLKMAVEMVQVDVSKLVELIRG